MKLFTSLRRQTLAAALCIIAIGLIFVIYPGTALDTLVRVLAAAALVVGAIKTAGYFLIKNADRPSRGSLALGLLIFIFALFFLIKPQLIVSILYVLIGFALLLDGMLQLQSAMDLRRFRSNKWVIVLALSALTILLAFVVLLDPFSTAKTLVMVSGIFLIVSGVTDLISLFFIGGIAPGFSAGRRRR